MSKYKPTLQDAASDLLRCVYCTENGFDDPDFLKFFASAKKIIRNHKIVKNVIFKEIKKIEDKSISVEKRREHLLNASVLLQ